MEEDKESNVMYIGHIPHGFYEKELFKYFSQFGKIKELRLSRNPKTGASRHYAFIKFKYKEVAKIAAKAMNGYILLNRKLVCNILSTKQLHKLMFKKSFKYPKNYTLKQNNKSEESIIREKSKISHEKRISSILRKQRIFMRKLKLLKIDYDYEGYPDKNSKDDLCEKDDNHNINK